MSNAPAHRLYRSRADRMLSGVSGGLAEYFAVDPVLVRLLWVGAAVLSGGALVLAYLALWILVPDEPEPRRSAVSGTPMSRPASEPLGEEEANVEGTQPSAGTGAGEDLGSTERWSSDPVEYGPAYTEHHTNRRRNGAGILLIILGLVFLANNMGLFRWFNWSLYWPVVLIAVGVVLLLSRVRR